MYDARIRQSAQEEQGLLRLLLSFVSCSYLVSIVTIFCH